MTRIRPELPGQLDVFEVLAAIEQEHAEPEPAPTAGPAPTAQTTNPEGGTQ